METNIKINGIKFYYDTDNLDINGTIEYEGKTFSVMEELKDFTKGELDEESYYVYFEPDHGFIIY